MINNAKIVAAAVQFNGVIFTIPKPARHHNIVHAMFYMGLPKLAQQEQGFLLDSGQYINRKDAAILALANGQVAELEAPPYLYSEDLW
jgi:hypothetical protein